MPIRPGGTPGSDVPAARHSVKRLMAKSCIITWIGLQQSGGESMVDSSTDAIEAQLTGLVTDVFARHIVLMTATGRFLADLSQISDSDIPLKAGDHIRLSGVIHASEVKVTSIDRISARTLGDGGEHILADEHETGQVTSALSILEANGFTILTAGRHESTHIEYLVSENRGGGLFELHTEFDGRLRKLKLVHQCESKWGPALG